MRKITEDSVQSFRNFQPFKRNNTKVIVEGNTVKMYLFDNLIAKQTRGGFLEISNCGWGTPTTKERLNGLPGVYIYQKHFTWYLNNKIWNGQWITIQNEES